MGFRGVDLSPILKDPGTATPVQEYVHFAYDDMGSETYPSHLRTVRTKDWKYTVYFNSGGTDSDYELYDLQKYPSEDDNLAGQTAYEQQQNAMDTLLKQVMAEKHTLPSPPATGEPCCSPKQVPQFTWPPKVTDASIGVIGQGKDPVAPKGATQTVADDQLIDEVDPLATEGAHATPQQIDELKTLLDGSDDDKAITAAEKLAKIGTPEARAALSPSLYLPVRSPEAMGKLHDAWGKYHHA